MYTLCFSQLDYKSLKNKTLVLIEEMENIFRNVAASLNLILFYLFFDDATHRHSSTHHHEASVFITNSTMTDAGPALR